MSALASFRDDCWHTCTLSSLCCHRVHSAVSLGQLCFAQGGDKEAQQKELAKLLVEAQEKAEEQRKLEAEQKQREQLQTPSSQQAEDDTQEALAEVNHICGLHAAPRRSNENPAAEQKQREQKLQKASPALAVTCALQHCPAHASSPMPSDQTLLCRRTPQRHTHHQRRHLARSTSPSLPSQNPLRLLSRQRQQNLQQPQPAPVAGR